jgi:RNA-directed DNA polymerase
MIRKFDMPEWKVHEMTNCRKGIWRSAKMLISVLTNKVITSLGYMSMADYYLKICEN